LFFFRQTFPLATNPVPGFWPGFAIKASHAST
jgi:hypothetical protein